MTTLALEPAAKFSVLVHQFAHELLHRSADCPESRDTRELEAEAVAFVVSQSIGLDLLDSSRDYIHLYRGDGDALVESLERIQRAAATIIAALDAGAAVLVVLCLDMKRRIITFHEVSRGTLGATSAHPREVFRAALLANAASVILAHNHPSGDPTPSGPDRSLTQVMRSAGDIVGVKVIDHIIVGDGNYFSFSAERRLRT